MLISFASLIPEILDRRGSWSDTACARAVRARDVIGPVRANVHRSSEEGARWDSQHVVSAVVSSRSILREAREWLNAVLSSVFLH